ncbi:MAG: hypothetical protein M1830_001253 [Pleopsidium flavum]|nr:MAG: hypothetical protein M1830_001253 [Pleopsidium flavum]
MPAWLNDAAAVSNTDNGIFTSSIDPSVAFMQNPSPTPFDLNQFQNQQLQQRMQNGNTRNASPAFHNPVYQTNSVIPSKRARPREDSLGASPRQAPGALSVSRSQTPHQAPYTALKGSHHGNQQFLPPTPYQHLQQGGSSDASPSPILQNQPFNPQGVSQRVQTVSPNPFSPAAQHFSTQISPSHSDHGSRVNTPQNNHAGYMQSMPYGTGSSQHFTPPPGATSAGTPNSMSAQQVNLSQNLQQQLPHAQRDYQMRLQQHVQQLQASNTAAQGRHQGSGLNPLAHTPTPITNPQMTGGPRQMQQQPMARPNNPEQFLRGVAQFMHARGLPLNTNPLVCGRAIHLMQLYAMVMKQGGAKKVASMNRWPNIANAMHFPPVQYPSAAQEIQEHYQRNLAAYEAAYLSMQQRQKIVSDQMHNMQQAQRGNAAGIPHQSSPVKQLDSQSYDQQSQQYIRQPPQPDQQTPMKDMTSMHNIPRHSATNGYLTPHQPIHNRPQSAFPLQRSNLSRPPEITPSQVQQKPFPSPSLALAGRKETINSRDKVQLLRGGSHLNLMPRKEPIEPHYNPGTRAILTHGGIEVSTFDDLVSQLDAIRPKLPATQELGIIDINALTMSLRCGIHAEVRLALDTLAGLSVEHRFQLALGECEDLLETLVECAEDQVEMLAENAAEVSDVMLISPYEDVVRGCRAEVETLQEVPEFGSLDYNLDHAVDRLICISTIIRNLSFFDVNHSMLAEPFVVKFMSTVVRYLGTRNMLLRTHRNTLDFMKDTVIYLSNLSHTIDLPGKEEALCIVHFLLSFAPCPPPTSFGIEEVMFTSYNPSTHQYLPPAVDSLAKLLARDDPNRTFYKAIFSADVTSTPPYDLLTRTFGLAIASIPEYGRENIVPIVEARKPYLAQGLLAAEVLVTLIPGSETRLARSWLSSQDNFPLSLLRIFSLLTVPQRHPQTGRLVDSDPQAHGMITHRGMAVLRKLVEKSKNPEQPSIDLPIGVLPRKESLLGLLLNDNVDSHFVRQLCAYARLEN